MPEKHSKKEVMNYIREQLDSGQSVEHITAHLMSYGHTEEDIGSILDEVLRQEESVKSRTTSRVVEILYVVIFVIFMFWVGASAKSPGETVIVGFSPTLIYIILTVVLIERARKFDSVLTLLPLALAFLFFIVGRIGSIPSFEGMEIGKLTVLNLILSYIFLFAIRYSELASRLSIESFIGGGPAFPEKEEPAEIEGRIEVALEAPKQEEYVEMKPKEEEEPLPKLLHSIESSCKALNSVVGRVYRKSNGGNSLIRDLIEIKKEWYNEFNTLAKTLDRERIGEVTDKIEKRLDMMFKTEKELFGDINLQNLKRDLKGNSRIIDVLIMNDNDPVETYFENALILCGKVKESIR